jgi:hypothetical protein
MAKHENNLGVEQKALSINLDALKYGTIVEIGAGQEVARHFFSAGAAAGTIAKTMSAYDMEISDQIYGKAHRYVGRERLEQMLSFEYDLLVKRLGESRSKETTFFAYAATVSAMSFKGGKECHGWVGIRLQLRPGEPCSNVILHVRMLDAENRLQSEALGILGVNIIHSAFRSDVPLAEHSKIVIESLLDNIEQDRLEVDLIHFSGLAFQSVENRLMNLHLIHSKLTRAVMFDAQGDSVVPADIMYRRAASIIRGSFNPPIKVHEDMIRACLEKILKIDSVEQDKVISLAEISMSEFVSGNKIDDADFLARVDMMNEMGVSVLVSDYLRFFRVRSWLQQYTNEPVAMIISVRDLGQVFDEEFYQDIEGGILEAMGKLFATNTKIYVYPALIDGELVTLENATVPEDQYFLLKYLIATQHLLHVDDYNESNLPISVEEVTKLISSGSDEWQEFVPDKVTALIKKRNYYTAN